MHKIILRTTVAAAVAFAYTSIAQAGVLVPVPQVPGSTQTDVYSINNNDVFTGDYVDQNQQGHGLIGTLDGQYTFFDYGTGNDTQGRYINNSGAIAGWATQRQSPLEYQFVRNADGVLAPIMLNGHRLKGAGKPGSLTDTGELAGQFEAQKKDGEFGKPKGYTGQGTDYTAELVLPFKRVYGTYPTGVNNDGDVAGYFNFCGRCDSVHGFIVKDGVATQIDYPDANAISTELVAINDGDLAVGNWRDSLGAQYAFLFDMPNNRFKLLDVDQARGISNSGLIAVEMNGQPYIYCLTKKGCPNGAAKALDIPDRWIPATPASVHAIICGHACRRSVVQ